jgi:hypothetical protein
MDKRGQKEYLLYLGCKGMLEPNAIGELTNCLWTFGPNGRSCNDMLFVKDGALKLSSWCDMLCYWLDYSILLIIVPCLVGISKFS